MRAPGESKVFVGRSVDFLGRVRSAHAASSAAASSSAASAASASSNMSPKSRSMASPPSPSASSAAATGGAVGNGGAALDLRANQLSRGPWAKKRRYIYALRVSTSL